MADASSVRYASTLPDPTHRNAGSIRFYTGTNQLVVSNGTSWEAVTTGLFETKVNTDALSAGSSSSTTDPVVGTTLWFVANRPITITAVKVGAKGAGSDVAGAQMDIAKVASGASTTYSAGSSILAAPVNLTAATGTVVGNSPALQTLTSTTANLSLVAGDALYVTYAATGKTAGQAIGSSTHTGTVSSTVVF